VVKGKAEEQMMHEDDTFAINGNPVFGGK